jgi:hypothetical protein
MTRFFAFLRFAPLAAALLAACDSTPSTPTALDSKPKSPAFATGKPTRSPVPDLAQEFVIPAGSACSFELAGDPVVNRLVTTTFPPDENGDIVQLTTGTVVERFTNVATGKSIIINISGPGRLTFHPDGSVTLEAWGTWFIVAEGPRAFINAGRVVLNITESGPVTVSQSGHEEDICAALS